VKNFSSLIECNISSISASDSALADHCARLQINYIPARHWHSDSLTHFTAVFRFYCTVWMLLSYSCQGFNMVAMSPLHCISCIGFLFNNSLPMNSSVCWYITYILVVLHLTSSVAWRPHETSLPFPSLLCQQSLLWTFTDNANDWRTRFHLCRPIGLEHCPNITSQTIDPQFI